MRNRPISNDAHVDAVQQTLGFKVGTILPNGDLGPPTVISADVFMDMVIQDHKLPQQVREMGRTIAEWGRKEGTALRVVDVVERKYRAWVAEVSREYRNTLGTKPTEKMVEEHYRTHPDYEGWQVRKETVEESRNAVTAVLEGFKIQARMLDHFVMRFRENATPNMSV